MYNGYKNYETWNVALWIQNDESWYLFAKNFKESDYKEFANTMVNEFNIHTTPDNVAWDDTSLDTKALDDLIKEL